MKTRKAFTLIELLFVVAIIAVLAGIAVPNFLEAQIRSKVSRTRQDMHVLSAALQAYYSDFNVYPQSSQEMAVSMSDPWTSEGKKIVDEHGTTATAPVATPTPTPQAYAYGGYAGADRGFYVPPVVLEHSGWALSVLTTPMPYFSRVLPTDLFADKKNTPFGYANLIEARKQLDLDPKKSNRRYYLFSYGPAQGTVANPLIQEIYSYPAENVLLYDPTNGTTSGGNLVRFGNE